MTVNFFETPIEFLKGVGPKRGESLKRELNIFTFGDLLSTYPYRYVDKSIFYKIREIKSDNIYVQTKGTIKNIQQIGSQRSARLVATLSDETGSIELVWFKGIKWLLNKLNPGVEYIVFGKPNIFNNKLSIPHPEVEVPEKEQSQINSKLQPFYSTTDRLKNQGLDNKTIGKLTKTLIGLAIGNFKENLSFSLIKSLDLIDKEKAMINIHHPENQVILDKAIFRLKFEELFFIQLKLLKLKLVRIEKTQGFRFTIVGNYFNNFYKHILPFELTGAQKKVMKEIRADLGSGKQMNRLLQGDVGSGKTLVALMSILIALDNGYQTCLMAPTEILAFQHYETLINLVEKLNINVKLLTGSTKKASRKIIHEELENGSLQILIGTHALIEEKVKFKNLGLVIIDEQHRFGVAQRAKLWNKNAILPHVLVMTATPIPRTLAMTLYGDLDVSVIDELPPGRKPIKTYHLNDSQRLRLYKFMKDQIKQGRQIYVVYPIIKESEKLDLKNLMEGYEHIIEVFPMPEYQVSILHGQMKPADKDFEMQRFIKGITQIMISTTVIEVGVDVPNASVMIIESAQRFGLSQLHQLRGRVGRGAAQSYCILMTDEKLSTEAKTRVNTMVRTTDGFEIAEVDLKLRGPGDLQGTQQSGILDLKIADIIRDEKILQYARTLAIKLLNEDPHFIKEENLPIKKYLAEISKNNYNWSLIS